MKYKRVISIKTLTLLSSASSLFRCVSSSSVNKYIYMEQKRISFLEERLDNCPISSGGGTNQAKMYVVRPDLRLFLPDLFDSLAAVIFVVFRD